MPTQTNGNRNIVAPLVLDPQVTVFLDQATSPGDVRLTANAGNKIDLYVGTTLCLSLNSPLSKTHVGLSNVDNTSDVNKPVSTAQAAADALKADKTIALTAGAGLTGGGDLSAARSFAVGAGTGITVNADDVALTVPVAVVNGGTGGTTAATARSGIGLGNVDNTSDLAKPISTATQTALNLKADLASPFTSTVNGVAPASGGGTVNFLRADGTWQTPPGGGGGISDAPSDNNYYERRNATWVSRGSSVLAAIATSGSASDLSAGTVPALRMPAYTGDVTSVAGAVANTIANDVVTYAKMQNVSATSRFIGRITAAAGDPEELTGTQATTLLDVFTTSLKGLAPSSGGGTTNFLRADGTWQVPPGSGGLADGDKGEITVASSGTVWTIDAGVVTYAKIQNVSATDKILGRSSAGAGPVQEITCTSFGRDLLDDASVAAQRTTLGLVAVASSGSAADLSAGTLLAARMPALTGDVTSTVNTVATTIANSAVTYAKIQNVSATNRLLGRSTAGAGVVEEITCTAFGRSLIDDADAVAGRQTLIKTINAQSGTTYAFVAADQEQLVTFGNAGATTVTVPPNSGGGSVPFPIGTQIDVVQVGAGKVTLAPGSGVTINSQAANKALAAQYAGATLTKTATNTWLLVGNLIA